MEGEDEGRARVFVSYRRNVDLAAARQVVLSLRQRLEEDQLFYAELDSSIPPVSRWKDQIDKGLDSAAVFVLVTGPDWLDELKRREADGKTDYQLYEIARALEADLPIFWVLMDGAGDRPPEPDDLPEEIRALCEVQAVDLPQRHFHHLVEPLVDRIVGLLQETGDSTRRNGRRSAGPRTELLVGPLETGAPFREIAHAVDAASPGSIVRVLPGTYHEPVVIGETVTILGAGPEATMLRTAGICLDVAADDVEIGQIGVVLESKDDGGVGIRVSGVNALIDGCDVAGGLAPGSIGIVVTESARAATVRSTVVHHLTLGIDLAGSGDHVVDDCRLTNLEETGILACAPAHVTDCDFKRIPRNAVVIGAGGEAVVERSRFSGKDRRYRCVDGGRLLLRGARGRAGTMREIGLAFNLGAIDKVNLSGLRERHRRGEKVRLRDTFTGGTDDVVVVVDGGTVEVHESDLAGVSVADGGHVRLLDCETEEIAVAASEIEIAETSAERIRASEGATVTLRGSVVRPVWKDSKFDYHPPAISVADGSVLRILDGSDIDTAHRNNWNGSAQCAGVVAKDSTVEVAGSTVLGLRATAITQAAGSLELHDATVDTRSHSGPTVDVSSGATVLVVGSSITGAVALGRARTTGTDSTFKGGLTATDAVVDLTGCQVVTNTLSGTLTVDGGTDLSCTGGTVRTPLVVRGHDVRVRLTDARFDGEVRVDAVGSVEVADCVLNKTLSVAGDRLEVAVNGGEIRSLTVETDVAVRDVTVRDVSIGSVRAELSTCEIVGRLKVEEGGSAELRGCTVRTGQVVVGGGGTATLLDCQIVEVVARGDGPDDAGLVVAPYGTLDVVGGRVASPQEIKAPKILLRRSTKEKAERLAGLGGARVVSVHEDGHARFERVAFSELGTAPVLLADGAYARFDDCTLDGEPWRPVP